MKKRTDTHTPLLPDALAQTLLLAVAPMKPRAALRAKVLRKAARAADEGFVTTVAASEEGWAELLPKVHAKRVFTDGTAESWLVRLEAGARAPAHDHPAAEECIVLQGSVRYLGGSTLHAGDYEVVLPGAHHGELVSDQGALVFLRYAAPLSQYLPQL